MSRWHCLISMFLMSLLIGPARSTTADIVLYTVPGSSLTFLLMGQATVNPGGTISFRHSRGMLYFGAQDCKIIKTKAKLQLYAAEKLAAEAEGTADAYLRLALWCVEKGLLTQADQAFGTAYQADAENERVKLMVQLVRYRRGTVPHSPAMEKDMREFVKNDEMKVARSRHFILMHDTADEKDLGNVSRVLWRRE